MDEFHNIYDGEDGINGANVYKPITDWTKEKLTQPFEPFFNIKPAGFAQGEDYPGIQALKIMNMNAPEVSARDIEARWAAPRTKNYDDAGNLTMKPRQYPDNPGLFGKTDEPAYNAASRESFKRGMKESPGQVADWLNKGGAAVESSMNPVENHNWQKQGSLHLGKSFEALPKRRDYGVPHNQDFSIDSNYKPGLAKDLSDQLLDSRYGDAGQALSAELKDKHLANHSAVNGKELWNRLKNDFGVEQAGQIINRLGYFSGVKGHPTFSGNEMIRFTPNEAERAMARMEREESYRDTGENPAYSAHGFDFGNRNPSWERELPMRPTYEEYGYDYEPGNDPRNYGVPKNTPFRRDRRYPAEMGEDLSRILSDPAYGEKGQKLARNTRFDLVRNNLPVAGMGVYDTLVENFGKERAHEILKRLDYFSGIDHVPDAPLQGMTYDHANFNSGKHINFDVKPGKGVPKFFR